MRYEDDDDDGRPPLYSPVLLLLDQPANYGRRRQLSPMIKWGRGLGKH